MLPRLIPTNQKVSSHCDVSLVYLSYQATTRDTPSAFPPPPILHEGIATLLFPSNSDESDTPTGSPVEEPDMISSSSGEDEDIITSLHKEIPTPLPHPSPQHVTQQPTTRQSNLPSQQISEDISPTPLRKLSTPIYGGSGLVTPSDSPSISRRPLIHTQGERGLPHWNWNESLLS